MGRLIDADELIKYIKIWEIGTSISSDQKEFINCVPGYNTLSLMLRGSEAYE